MRVKARTERPTKYHYDDAHVVTDQQGNLHAFYLVTAKSWAYRFISVTQFDANTVDLTLYPFPGQGLSSVFQKAKSVIL